MGEFSKTYSKSEVVLSVPYFSQVDNATDDHGPGYRQCNLTVHAMAIDFLTKGALSKKAKELGFCEPESYYGKLLAHYGDTTKHLPHTQCIAQEFDIRSEWRYDLRKTDLIAQLDKQIPVPMGVAYKKAGHIILGVGYDDVGLLVHDPYGVRQGTSDSYNVGVSGAHDRYTWNLLNRIYWDKGSDCGWGRIFA